MLGPSSIFSAGVLAGWDKGQLLIFSSYTFGLFTLIALVLGSIFLAYPLLRKNKKLLFGITIFLDWIFLIYLAADAFIYPLYRAHLNFAMIQMTFLGGGRIVSFSLPMIFEIAVLDIRFRIAVLDIYLYIFQVGDLQKAIAHGFGSSFSRLLLFQPLLLLGIC